MNLYNVDECFSKSLSRIFSLAFQGTGGGFNLLDFQPVNLCLLSLLIMTLEESAPGLEMTLHREIRTVIY